MTNWYVGQQVVYTHLDEYTNKNCRLILGKIYTIAEIHEEIRGSLNGLPWFILEGDKGHWGCRRFEPSKVKVHKLTFKLQPYSNL